MSEPRKVTITLGLTVDGEEVGGVAATGEAAERAFHGWVGLVGAIDSLVAAAPAAVSPVAGH